MALSRCWRRSSPRKSISKRDRKLHRPLLRSGDQLQHSLQATQEKLHEALTLRREQEAELMGPRAGGS